MQKTRQINLHSLVGWVVQVLIRMVNRELNVVKCIYSCVVRKCFMVMGRNKHTIWCAVTDTIPLSGYGDVQS